MRICQIYNNIWLVVFSPTPPKNHGVKVSWDDFSLANMVGKS
jgi:hypothetical protein